MRPRTNHVRERQPDDEERILAAQAALKRHLPGLDIPGTEIMFRVFLWGFEPQPETDGIAPSPTGLTKTREQLDSLCAKALAFIDALEVVYENANIMGELYYRGLDIEALQEQVRQSIRTAREVQGNLPEGKKWPKMPNPLHELIRQLAAAYEDSTKDKAHSGVKHSREPERFHGPFFDLVADVLYQLDLTEKSNLAMGKAIRAAL